MSPKKDLVAGWLPQSINAVHSLLPLKLITTMNIEQKMSHLNAVNTFVGGTRLPDTDLLGSGSLDDEIFGAVSNILGNRSTRQASNGIYLKPFLDPADGGTGEYLNQSGQPLNPDNFR